MAYIPGVVSKPLFPSPVKFLQDMTKSISRVNDNTIKVVTPTKTIRLEMASQRNSVPYYKTYRRTLDISTVSTWPLLVRRRFLLDFKDQLVAYVARPSRATRSILTSAIDVIISKAIQRDRT